MKLPYIPADIPFTGDQKAWLAGFLAGLNTRIVMPGATEAPDVHPTAEGAAAIPLDIAFGTQTGTAELLAEQAADLARSHGFLPRLIGLDNLDLGSLAATRRLLVITSTYGEGDMPENAEAFWEALAAPDAPRLEGLYFGVLGLGDSIYDGFCQAGRNIDARLAELGATRVLDRVDCDVDYEGPSGSWLAEAVPALAGVDGVDGVVGDSEATTERPSAATPAATGADEPTRAVRPAKWGRKNPYPATIVANTVLSGPGSAKEVRHMVLSLGDSGIDYQPGDGLSVAPVNDPVLVQHMIDRLGVPADTVVTDRKSRRTLVDALTNHYEISMPSKYLVDYIAARSNDPELTHLCATGDKEALDAWLWGKDVLDLLNVDASLQVTPEELIAELRPLTQRVYSISSSPRAHAGTVHLTMATVRYHAAERDRGGVCSTYLADRRAVGETVNVYVTPNKSFRLPDADIPIIMIGPGTGVAPFRAFLHERQAAGTGGESWLFFGDQHQDCDYLYADEIAQFLADGTLTRVDLAFSRDQEHKIYVQDRMRENGAELYAWLQRGAHIYVCGDATRMARDVEEALQDIVAEYGGFDADAAQDHLAQLKKAKRYLRDVY